MQLLLFFLWIKERRDKIILINYTLKTELFKRKLLFNFKKF